MRKKVCISLAAALFFMSCTAPAAGYFSGPETVLAAEEVQETQLVLNDLSGHEKEVEEELKFLNDSFDESPQWKDGAYILSEEEYPWVQEARDILIKYFQEEYGIDISKKVNEVEVYTSPNVPVFLYGFYDGTGKVFMNKNDINKEYEFIMYLLLHEMVHSVGVDFYNDKSGMKSNALYEGLAEALTKRMIETSGDVYDGTSAYAELRVYGEKILEADSDLIPELAEGKETDIVTRIDEKLGKGVGDMLLEAAVLMGSGTDDEKVRENCDIITEAYGRQ